MKNVVSTTGCVHAMECGSEKEGYMTRCRHVDFFKSYGDGYWHQWELTDKEVTCKRCLLVLATENPVHVDATVYQWPASQICHGCTKGEIVTNLLGSGETYTICWKGSKLNNGRKCADYTEESSEDEAD